MLQGLTRLAIAAPRRIIAVAVLLFVAAAIFGVPVINRLSGGGFQDPTSESSRAAGVLRDKFSQTDQQMLIVVTTPTGVRSDQAAGSAPTSPISSTVAVGVERVLGVDRTARGRGRR